MIDFGHLIRRRPATVFPDRVRTPLVRLPEGEVAFHLLTPGQGMFAE
ncbi:hypothetical protein AB0J35_07930 [Nonomuraea angiospora]